MAFKIEYTDEAEADLDAIITWLIERRAGQAVARWFEGLQAAVATLEELPQRCPLMEPDPRVASGARKLFYGKKPHVFRNLFRIAGDTIAILHIRRGKRSTPELQ